MTFIKLTLQDGREIHVNAERIFDISKQIDKEGSLVCSGQTEYGFNVNESPEEIIEMIKVAEEINSELIVGVNDFEFNIPDMEKYLDEKEFKNLQDIKDEVFSEVGWIGGEITGDEVDAIAERYAKECCKASLSKAKKEIELLEGEGYFFQSEKITQLKNIVLL